MNSEKLIKEFESIFYPKSIAVVGASRDEFKVGNFWVKGLINSGFEGKVYPVNPSGGEIFGLKIYPSLTAIPETVEYVIVSIPRQAVLELLEDCAKKKVKAVHFFTAGFREAGGDWNELEGEMVRKARKGGFRIIGPNCIGIYSPEVRIPLGPGGDIGKVGSVGFVSQSGGHAAKLLEMGNAREINFSKIVSFGNGADLDGVDFIEYLAHDPKTTIIGAYLEGTRDGRRLFQVLQWATKRKPVVLWKGGRTKTGAETAASHTGSLASPAGLWSAVLKQAGAVEVQSLEELSDSLLLFQQIGRFKGTNAAVISGLADGGGGSSVSASDICSSLGLNLPYFSQETRNKLKALLGEVGSILRNPLDVSQSYGNPLILEQAINLVGAEPSIHIIILQEDVDILTKYTPWEAVVTLNSHLLDYLQRQHKPVVIALPPGSAEAERLEVERYFVQSGIPVFPSLERAAKAIVNVSSYYRNLPEESKNQ